MAATAATLAFTTSGAVDSSGNLYIADSGNDYVRKVDVRGDISRVAGTGAQGDSGDGGPAARAELQSAGRIRIDADGNLYIVDTDAGRVRKVTAFRTSSIAP